MKNPQDESAPLFVYGLFKPGQLGYHRIEPMVENASAQSVSGQLRQRDGLPIFVTTNDEHRKINGFLLEFHRDRAQQAYEAVNALEPHNVYYWGTIECGSGSANILLGRSPNKGSSEYEYSEWSGESDPLFGVALEEVERLLDENGRNRPGLCPLPVIRLQMAYMLLWSALERYASLKYYLGKEDIFGRKIVLLAEEKQFAAALSSVVKKPRRILNAAKPKESVTLDPMHPKNSISYYYQVRSNATHRGKAIYSDFEVLRDSTRELLYIFREMLKEAFRLKAS